MKLPQFEYLEPKSIGKACQVLKEQGGKALAIAGGTDLLMALKNWLKTPEMLVDLKGIPRLNQMIYSNKNGLEIGPLVSLRHLANNTIIRNKYPILSQAASEVGTPQLQSMGTIGGNLCQDNLCVYYNRSPMSRQMFDPCHKLGGNVCHAVKGSKTCWATFCGDMAPALLVLRAKVKIRDSNGESIIPLSEFYSGDGKKPNILKPGEIISEIRVPPLPSYSGGSYFKLRLRKAIDYPLLGVALNLTMENKEGICKDVALALTGVERAPLWIKEVDRLKGKKLVEEIIEELAEAAHKQAHPLNNICELTPAYRKDMVKVYVERAFHQALKVAKRGGQA